MGVLDCFVFSYTNEIHHACGGPATISFTEKIIINKSENINKHGSENSLFENKSEFMINLVLFLQSKNQYHKEVNCSITCIFIAVVNAGSFAPFSPWRGFS